MTGVKMLLMVPAGEDTLSSLITSNVPSTNFLVPDYFLSESFARVGVRWE